MRKTIPIVRLQDFIYKHIDPTNHERTPWDDLHDILQATRKPNRKTIELDDLIKAFIKLDSDHEAYSKFYSYMLTLAK